MEKRLQSSCINLIKRSQEKSLSVAQIHRTLRPKYPRLTKNQVKNSLREAINTDRDLRRIGQPSKFNILPNKGGNGFRYIGGGETTRKGTGPYRDIARILDSDSKKVTKIFGAPHLNSFDVHAGKSSRGRWGRPDLIVALYRTVGSARPFSLHSIEFEGRGKFSPANVAQTFFSGKGANMCWLLFDSADWPKNSRQRRENPDALRVREFAKELGVGLIYYKTLGHVGGWFVLEPAKHQRPGKIDKKALKHLFDGETKVEKVVSRK